MIAESITNTELREVLDVVEWKETTSQKMRVVVVPGLTQTAEEEDDEKTDWRGVAQLDFDDSDFDM